MSLAVDSYLGLELADGCDLLNLSWSLDERGLLEPELTTTLAEALDEAMHYVSDYAVGDPYGDRALAGPVAERFGIGASRFAVRCGAGVGALLAASARALQGQRAAVIGPVYPDFPEWLCRANGVAVSAAADEVPSDAAAVFCEHPPIRAPKDVDAAVDVNMLARVARAAAPRLVIVDESNANYMPACRSAVALIANCPNLLILRGVSKAYSMGALRLGYAVSSPAAADWLRRALPPLQVSSLSLAMSARLLALPQETEARLFAAIAASKAAMRAGLEQAGLPVPVPVHHALPHFLFDPDARTDHAAAVAELERRGIRGKRNFLWEGGIQRLMRYAAPLQQVRQGALAERLTRC